MNPLSKISNNKVFMPVRTVNEVINRELNIIINDSYSKYVYIKSVDDIAESINLTLHGSYNI